MPCPPFPPDGLGWCIDPFWTRFLISDELILPSFPALDWDGSGQLDGYLRGETEDIVPATDPGQIEILPPPPEFWFDSIGQVTVTLDPFDKNCFNGLTIDLSSHGPVPASVRRFGRDTFTTGAGVLTCPPVCDPTGLTTRPV